MALTTSQKQIIAETLPSGRVFYDLVDHPAYLTDATELSFSPDALFFAEDEADIVAAVNLCRRLTLPLIPRGAGTGYSGGALAIAGGLLLSTERMKSITIDRARQAAVVGPGVLTGDIMAAAEEAGLFYPPDPASYLESTIGGNLAENAGGLRCKKYGVTKDYVLGFRAVMADGSVIAVDSSAPFGLVDILVGSEGTLCAYPQITLRLIDLPQPGETILAVFGRAVDAASVVAEVTAEGIVPCAMEFIDGDAVACVNQYDPQHRIDEGAALLLFETDGPQAVSEAERIKAICRRYSPTTLREATDAEQRNTLWQTRRNVSKAVKESARSKTAEDVCVPPSALPDLVAYVEELGRTLLVRVNCYGHAGDGNLHVNFLGMTGNPAELDDIAKGVALLFERTLQLGGTLSGEHGIGITKKDFLAREFDPATLAFMKCLKKALDPDALFNPGKIFV